MASTVSKKTILKHLTGGDAEHVLVADFQAWTTAPRLSRMLSRRAEGHPVYQVDPVGVLSGDQLYLPLQDLAQACVAEFLASGPTDGRVFIVGHCSASALSLHVARLLEASRSVSVILVGPAWPDEEHIWNRFAEFLSNLGAAERACPELRGDPAAAVARMERVLDEEVTAMAASQGVDGAADVFAELLAWYRGWLAFLLSCHNDPPMTWPVPPADVVVLTSPEASAVVPGLGPDAYQHIQIPALRGDDPVTPELVECLLAQFALHRPESQAQAESDTDHAHWR